MSLRRILAFTFLVMLTSGVAFSQQFNVLVFSKTEGWHHDSIPAGVAAIEHLGQLHDFTVFWTEDANRVFDDKALSKYQVVVFLSTSGDILNSDQKAAFERFIRHGGGFVGIHSASDTEYGWTWYTKLVGRMFYIHPAIQTATVEVLDRNFPGMEFFPKRFLATDEWYQFQPAVADNLHYLLAVDETTYDPHVVWGDQHKQGDGMGKFHPIAWYHTYDGGRAFYTAMGHLSATYGDPIFQHFLFGGIYWAATGKGFKAE